VKLLVFGGIEMGRNREASTSGVFPGRKLGNSLRKSFKREPEFVGFAGGKG
jgi:hypothetical protein